MRTTRWAAAVGLVVLACVPVMLGRLRPQLPLDLVVYRTGGEAVLHGWPLYDPTFLVHSGGHLPFTYPPFAAVVFAPMGWLPVAVDHVAWSVVCLLALVVLVVVSFRPLVRRWAPRNQVLVVGGLTAAAVVTEPVTEHLSLGQVGIPLVLLCVLDIVPATTRWPRGLLVGIAVALRLTPGLFVVHFLVTRQWRAAATAAVTTVAVWTLSAVVKPADSWTYFFGGTAFHPDRLGAVLEVANQSVWATLHRWFGDSGELPWLLLALVVAVVGLYRARLAHLAGDRLAVVALVGITSELVAPVSWMHHAAWLVPALGVLVADGRRTGRVVAAVAVWVVLLWLQPHPPHLDGSQPWYEVVLLHESLVYVYLALLVLLPIGTARRASTSYPSTVATRA